MRRIFLVAVLVVSCSPNDESAPPPSSTSTTQTRATTTTTTSPSTTTTEPKAFGVSSPSFEDGTSIPRDFTCDGADVSPELDIVGIPAATQSLAIIVDDPDAPLGSWDHWIEFDIRSEVNSLEVPRDSEPIGTQGINSWHLTGYMGPCPPEGEDHEYVFTVYALDTLLDLPSGVDSGPVLSAMEGHVIASAVLTGTYGR